MLDREAELQLSSIDLRVNVISGVLRPSLVSMMRSEAWERDTEETWP